MNYFELIQNYPFLFENKDAAYQVITDEKEIALWQKEQEGLRTDGDAPEQANIGVVYSDSYIFVIQDLVEFPDGRRGGFARVITKGSLQGAAGIAVLGFLSGKVLLLRDYRHATRRWHIEIPRGYGEPGLSGEETARKELREEADAVVSGPLVSLGFLHPNTGLEELAAQLFFAHLSKTGQPDQNEGISNLILVSVSELEDMISNGTITDAFTISAYTRAKLLGLFVQQE